MSIWLNNKIKIWKNVIKPCKLCNFCPYGELVEEFPLQDPRDEKMSCEVFGHDCPAFYHVEMFAEQDQVTDKEIKDFKKEIKSKNIKKK